MSYDYNGILDKIVRFRQEGKLQDAVDQFSTLSSVCPMTPLLWMQYAFDNKRLMGMLGLQASSANVIRLQTLELGIAEFPGSLLLRLHYLQLLVQEQQQEDPQTIHNAFRTALSDFWCSHGNEDGWLVKIYNLYATYCCRAGKEGEEEETKDAAASSARQVFVARASVPMKQANESLLSELKQFGQDQKPPLQLLSGDAEQTLEDARRHASNLWRSLFLKHNDQVEMAMENEQIRMNGSSNDDDDDNDIDWEMLLLQGDSRSLMGLGGNQTAQAFQKFAQACSRTNLRPLYGSDGQRLEKDNNNNNNNNTNNNDKGRNPIRLAALDVYERGVAECPTVESLWLSYLRALSYVVTHGHASLTSRLLSASSRAVRNCPYSLKLAQQRLVSEYTVAQVSNTPLDCTNMVKIVQDTLDLGFLPNPAQFLDLYLTIPRLVRRRILSLLDPQYDEPLADSLVLTDPTNIADAVHEELQDLADDVDEVYEQIDIRVRKKYTSWTEGRMFLWKEWATVQTQFLTPLNAENDSTEGTNQQLRRFQKMLKFHQSPHPDCFAAYIQALLSPSTTATTTTSMTQMATNFRRVRGLYQRAMRTKPPKEVKLAQWRHYETSMHNLGQDYLQFELLYGSEKSYTNAARIVQKKQKATPLVTPTPPLEPTVIASQPESGDEEPIGDETSKTDGTSAKRKTLDKDKPEQPVAKKARVEEGQQDVNASTAGQKPTSLKKEVQGIVHKVRVGKLEYPAHPFTVRVFNLGPGVQDMDLVDTLRPQCGNIVHARIMRERQQHQQQHSRGKSKGWALVQFEERESVEKALALHDTIGIHEKLLHIARSHTAAVSLVPPGMHRVQPKGQGKVSKRNERRKETIKREEEQTVEKVTKSDQPEAGLLAFQPRGVSRKQRRKAKMTL